MKSGDIFLNKKTQNKYQVLIPDAINATNKDNGKVMVVYHKVDDISRVYVRELDEFKEKFADVI